MDRTAASEDGAEDRRVCVMFTDLVGSTELFGELGDARAHGLVSQHFDLIAGIAHDHGGRVVKNLGDGLMIVYRAAEDAVHAALRMQEAVALAGQSHPPKLGLRVGLGAGEAIEDAGDFFGGPVIVASRLCARSSPGQILATTEVATLAQAEAEVVFAETGSLALKGIADPVPSCEVLARGTRSSGVGPASSAPDPAMSGLPLPNPLRTANDEFVGRDAELAFLRNALATTEEGITQLVLPGRRARRRQEPAGGRVRQSPARRRPHGAVRPLR